MSPGKRDDHWAASKTSKIDATKFRRRRIPGNVASRESETDEIFLSKLLAGGVFSRWRKLSSSMLMMPWPVLGLHRIKNSLGDLYEGVKVSSSLDFKSLDSFVTYKYIISHWRGTLAPIVKTCTKYFQPPKRCFGSIPVQHHPQVLYQLLFLY